MSYICDIWDSPISQKSEKLKSMHHGELVCTVRPHISTKGHGVLLTFPMRPLACAQSYPSKRIKKNTEIQFQKDVS
uniref:Uncharacterized protein n=1 Tax=Rhizophagus irregularis (strain DAOM 181602 / DAOM 197198 / MUCL 43194) TaxID=747089 RepID=U9THE8_RHIID